MEGEGEGERQEQRVQNAWSWHLSASPKSRGMERCQMKPYCLHCPGHYNGLIHPSKSIAGNSLPTKFRGKKKSECRFKVKLFGLYRIRFHSKS
jgi:hypothetical protein